MVKEGKAATNMLRRGLWEKFTHKCNEVRFLNHKDVMCFYHLQY